jgi:rfaE bifunctional protein nucleotidyltransferase chain/domain
LGAIYNIKELLDQVTLWRKEGKRIVFTNGCFDIIHRGHIEYLGYAKSYGDILILGLNSDRSVRALKGAKRPYNNQDDRAFILSQLVSVDAVCIFDEDKPNRLLENIKPDILVKGGDYTVETVVGREIVEGYGGEVKTVPLIKGKSTTSLIDKLQNSKTNSGHETK